MSKMKEKGKIPEEGLNETEANSFPDAEFKARGIRMSNELRGGVEGKEEVEDFFNIWNPGNGADEWGCHLLSWRTLEEEPMGSGGGAALGRGWKSRHVQVMMP